MDKRVEWLERSVIDLQTRVSSLPEQWQQDLSNAARRQIHLREEGLALLVAGILLTVLGNLLPA